MHNTAVARNHVSPKGVGTLDDLTPREGQEYGTQYACSNCDAEEGLMGGYFRVREEPTHWWMGLDSTGNANYFCDECKTLGIDVHPCMPRHYRG